MYEAELRAVADLLKEQEPGFFAPTVDRAALVTAADTALRELDRDIARLKKETAVLFPPVPTDAAAAEKAGHDLAALFDRWRADPPSTAALVCVAAGHFGIPADDKNLKAALMSALAAGVPHDNPYHSTSHFREVTAATARLAHINNALAASGTRGAEQLEPADLAKCLLAAAAHDLLHDGKGNSPDGARSWQQYRLEDKSIAATEPFMALAGMMEKDIEDIRAMIRATDITYQGFSNHSPHGFLRRAYRDAFEDAGVAGAPAKLAAPAGLGALSADNKLLVMAALLSDADLSPSTATDYAFGRKMTTLFSQEMPATSRDSDQTLVGFIKYVTEKKLTSAAGNAVSGGALTGIYTEASARAAKEADAKPQGNPPPVPPKPAL